jgi:hypothetical protein
MIGRRPPTEGGVTYPSWSVPTAGPAPTAAPGWYPDPHGQAAHRWFDGSRWTGHVDPVRAAANPYVLPNPAAFPASNGRSRTGGEYWLVPVGRSREAVLAPWVALGAFFLGPLGLSAGITAIVLAICALCLPRDEGRAGRGRPVVAIVLGLLAVAASFMWTSALSCGCG